MDSLRYNIRWAQHTFSSTSNTEALLSPERDAGTITSKDYEASVAFFPGPHRRYTLLGGAMGVPAYFMVPKQFRGTPRSYGVVMGASMVGYMVGQAMAVAAHINFVKSIEDPIGFAQAMDNIQKQNGVPVPPGPMIVRQGKTMALEHGDNNGVPQANEPAFEPPTQDVRQPTSGQDSPPVKQAQGPSRWDQIRAANAGSARNSTWDAIRQSHERPKVLTSSAAPAIPSSDFDRTGDYDRKAAQAEFDELLEKERNFKG